MDGFFGALLLAAALGAAPDEGTSSCFEARDLDKGPEAPVPAGDVRAVQAALAGAQSYRACVSFASLFSGFARATVEYSRPDRVRWQVRHRPHGHPATTLEVLRIGKDVWHRTEPDAAWQKLAAGQTLEQVAPKTWRPAEPAELLRGLLEDPAFVRSGEAKARAGPAAIWRNKSEPPGITSFLWVGLADHLPYRYNGGGPPIEAYLQMELYDFGAKVEIEPPR